MIGVGSQDNNALIDWVCPVNWLAPLNGYSLRRWWLCVPGAMGGREWHDMTKANHATVLNTGSFSGGSSPQYGRLGSVLTPAAIQGSFTLAATSSSVLPLSGGVTIAIWHRKTDATLRGSALFGITFGASGTECGSHCPYSDGKIYWDFGGSVEGTSRLSVSATFSAVVWDHFVFTSGSRGMEIWRNGAVIASNSGNATRTASSNSFLLGRHGTTSSDACVNDDMRLYAEQLPAAKIIELYHASRTGYQAELRRVRRHLVFSSPAASFDPATFLYSNQEPSKARPWSVVAY